MNLIVRTTPAYPGAHATAREIVLLADAYRAAAVSLQARERSGEALGRLPARLCAVHAIELYLNAYLLHAGMGPEAIRGCRHDLAERNRRAETLGLKLRRRTSEHLARMTAEREYLVLRYGPEMAGTVSECTRVKATMEEVARKVRPSILVQALLSDPRDGKRAAPVVGA
jgi:hypothetical protein